jgi:hypothetical protein
VAGAVIVNVKVYGSPAATKVPDAMEYLAPPNVQASPPVSPTPPSRISTASLHVIAPVFLIVTVTR